MVCIKSDCYDGWIGCRFRSHKICNVQEENNAKESDPTKKAPMASVSALRLAIFDLQNEGQHTLVSGLRSYLKSRMALQKGKGGNEVETQKKKPAFDSTVIGIIKLRMYCKNEHIKAERILVSSTDQSTYFDNLERVCIYSYMTSRLGKIIESATGIMPKGY